MGAVSRILPLVILTAALVLTGRLLPGPERESAAPAGTEAATQREEEAGKRAANGKEKDGTKEPPADGEKKNGAGEASADGKEKDGGREPSADGEKKNGAGEASADGKEKDGMREAPAGGREKNGTGIQEQPGTEDGREAGPAPGTETQTEAAGNDPPVLFLATDLHYQSPQLTDFRSALDLLIRGNDGTLTLCLEALTEAFLEEIIAERPDALILSGDLSQNGEKENHLALAKKLQRVQERGIPVLVIPGNHDIGHPGPSTYYDDRIERTAGTDAKEFLEIYHAFGYDGASSRDPESLSYLYRLRETYWIMMLDSCIYEPVHSTGGRIREGTLSWMREQLALAQEAGATVVPVSHHNLLDESTLYPEECTLENAGEVTALLEEFGVPVYFSGHLHLQRTKKHVSGPAAGEDSYGIWEIVGSPVSISPCQYGIATWGKDGSFSYRTKAVDVESWAARYGEEDERLLHFREWSEEFLLENMAYRVFYGIEGIPEERRREMALFYARLYRDYCAGSRVSVAEIRKDPLYQYWIRYSGTGVWGDNLKAILADLGRDHTVLTLPAGEGIMRPQTAGRRE